MRRINMNHLSYQPTIDSNNNVDNSTLNSLPVWEQGTTSSIVGFKLAC